MYGGSSPQTVTVLNRDIISVQEEGRRTVRAHLPLQHKGLSALVKWQDALLKIILNLGLNVWSGPKSSGKFSALPYLYDVEGRFP
jgi:hypothetical protein